MKNLMFLFFVSLIIFSCSNEDELVQNIVNDSGKEEVLKERDPDYPWASYEFSGINRVLASKSILAFEDYLGRATKDDFFPVGNIESVTYSVVDIKKLSKEKPSYISAKRLNIGTANSFSYSNFERYTEKSNTTSKVSGGFSLGIKLFSIGAKKNMTTVFSKNTVEEKKSVFGEVDVMFKSLQYVMQKSSRIQKEIILNYLSTDFKEELYGTTPSELYNNYGGFVLSGFITGGRATALYTGLYTGNELETAREVAMNTDINASYGFKMNNGSSGSVSGDLGFGTTYSNGSTSSEKITSLKSSVKTIGGTPEFSGFSSPQNVDNMNINLSGWLRSLNDENTHSIVDIPDNSFSPLTDFVMEENLKKGLSNCYESEVNNQSKLQEPYINIRLSYVSGALGVVQTSLITRFNDDIILKSQDVYMAEVGDYIQSEKARVSDFFGIKIVNNNNLNYEVKVNFDGIDNTKMTKYIDSVNNTIYLLYSVGGKKFGYSIHTDRILDDYVMRSFVNRLSSISIDPFDLFDYTIVAL